MLTLGIDTSNYATSLAVYDTAAKEVVCAKKRFLPVKQGSLGLRQSEALFHHIEALPGLLNELNSKVDLAYVEAVGVSSRPRPVEGSYMPCFLAGVNFAQAFAASKHLPVLSSTHQQGHIAAALLGAGQAALIDDQYLVFHVSGGTTDLILCNSIDHLAQIGSSSDLYAGQAVDRLGKMLDLPFPSGKYISDFAEKCVDKVRVKVSVQGCNCSLSGLENQCKQLLLGGASAEYVCKYCLISIAETIVKMAQNALQLYPNLPIICAGGVMSSELIAQYVKNRLPCVYFSPSLYSSDNAIGISYLAGRGLNG